MINQKRDPYPGGDGQLIIDLQDAKDEAAVYLLKWAVEPEAKKGGNWKKVNEARPGNEDEKLIQSAGKSFAPRERRLREVKRALSSSTAGKQVPIGRMPQYRVAAASATALKSVISLCYAAACDVLHRDYWQAVIELPIGVAATAALAVRISDGSGHPLVGGHFRIGKGEIANGGGLAILPFACLRENLRSNVVRYEFADGRKIRGSLCL